jgi:hypothetical protein
MRGLRSPRALAVRVQARQRHTAQARRRRVRIWRRISALGSEAEIQAETLPAAWQVCRIPRRHERWHWDGNLCDPAAEIRREDALTLGVALLIELGAQARALAPRR